MNIAYMTEPGLQLSKRGGTFVIAKHGAVIQKIPAAQLEGIVVCDAAQITSQAMVACLQRGIPLTWISSRGACFGRLESTSCSHILQHQQQLQCQHTPFSLAMGRKVIQGKIHNQITLLRRYQRNVPEAGIARTIHVMKAVGQKVGKAADSQHIMGYEGLAARLYFAALGSMMEPALYARSRSMRPPRAPFNSLISFGYTLVFYELYTALLQCGLHPYIGFLHALRNDHPALASDLLEEWRPVLIDSLALSLLRRGEMTAEDFEGTPQTGVYLTAGSRKKFLCAYEQKMNQCHQYGGAARSFRHTLRHQAKRYYQAVMTRDASYYEPLWLR